MTRIIVMPLAPALLLIHTKTKHMKTAESQKKVYDLHHEHQLWMNQLNFFEDELKIFKHRLEEIAKANNKAEVLKMVEHFQNAFIIQKNEIDVLKHTIRLAEQELVAYIDKNPEVADKRKKEDDAVIREKMARFEKLFRQMKEEFVNFVARVL